MPKYLIKGSFVEYIYADNEDQALEIFDQIIEKEQLINLPFDEYSTEEIEPIQEM